MSIIQQPYMNEPWFAILSEQVAQTSRAKVASELNYSLTSVSLIMNGKYAGKPDRLRDKVLKRYTRVHCPYVAKIIPLHQCQDTAHGKAPTHNPMKMQQWRACQSCSKKEASCPAATQD